MRTYIFTDYERATLEKQRAGQPLTVEERELLRVIKHRVGKHHQTLEADIRRVRDIQARTIE